MGITNNLTELIKQCKAAVYLTANQHKDSYESVEEYLTDRLDKEHRELISKEVLTEMISKDIILQLQFYPDSPIGSYTIYHYDLESLINKGLEILREQNDHRRTA